jgi:hypothetical protein
MFMPMRNIPALNRRWRESLFGLCMLGALCSNARATETPASQLYEMSTETGMPHLEFNLRYAVVKEQRCMNLQDLSAAFWMLKDVSLQDCRLEKLSHQADAASYGLVCDGGHGTSGGAQWQLGPDRISGTLNVRLGGKNMTFYQRVTARPIGACTRP